jgi:hypothetical protein
MFRVASAPGMTPESALWRTSGRSIILNTVEGDIVEATWPEVRITHVLSHGGKYRAVQMPDDECLLVGQQARNTYLWTYDTRTKAAKQISFGVDVAEGSRGVGWTADGRVLYTASYVDGPSAGIWVRSESGGEPRRLTTPPDGALDCNPYASPDGRYVVFERFDHRAEEPYSIRRVSPSGGAEDVLLQTGDRIWRPVVSPDSRAIYFCRGAEPESPPRKNVPPPETWRMTIDGGGVELVVRDCGFVDFDRSGALILCSDGAEVKAVPVTGGKVTSFGELGPRVRFSPAGGIGFVQSPSANVLVRPVGGGAPRPETNFSEHAAVDFAWSPSGNTLVIARDHRAIDLLLMEGFP